MKKRMLLLIGFMVLMLAPLLSQTVVADWKDLYDNYGVFFATYLGVAAVASFLGEYVIRLLYLVDDFLKIAVVVILAVGLSFLAGAINIGYLAEGLWYEILLWGALSAATAAGLRSSNILFFKSIVDFFIGFLKSKEPKTV